ncbi:MAG: hypothetical protein KIC74_10925 [Neisseria sp.]|nr:hypothetical protein [Neisseria sp.]
MPREITDKDGNLL